MNVRELNKEQLEKLKLELYYMDEKELEERFCESLDDDAYFNIVNATIWLDIKDETVYQLYDGIYFVEEDF